MLARVPILSAYDPSPESMLAHASPSYKIATMITGLVIDCLWTNHSLVLQKLSTKQLNFIILKFTHSFIISQITPSFILVKYF